MALTRTPYRASSVGDGGEGGDAGLGGAVVGLARVAQKAGGQEVLMTTP